MSKYHAVSSGFVTKAALPSITRQRGTTTGSANLMLYGAGKTTVSNNTTFIDSSANAFTVTRNGDTVQSGFNPFSQASAGAGLFDGNGDYLSCASNAAFAFGSGDFTIEYWLYASSWSLAPTIVDTRTTGNSTNGYSDFITSGGVFSLYLNNTVAYTMTGSLSLNTWTHIAVSRSGTSLRVFINGTQNGSTVTNSTVMSDTNLLVAINRGLTAGTIGPSFFNGYLSNVRLVKGTAVYTSNFTPSTSPLTAISGTSLLLLMDNYSIVNSTSTNLPVTINGNTTISTAQYPTGMSSSIYFDGSGDTLFLTGLNMSSVNWTIEGYVYFVSFTTTTVPHIFNFGTDINNRYVAFRSSLGKFGFTTANSGVYVGAEGTTTVSTGVWYHFAAVRNGSSTYLYINGTLEATVTSSINAGTSWYFGGQGFSVVASDFLNGYLSNVRIVRGTALYTANFTPPSAPLSTAISVPNFVTNNIYGVNQIP